MSAAIEGELEGASSIGFSLCDHDINADFTQARKFVEKIIAETLKHKLPKGVCLNVNIPPFKSDELKGIKVCRQAQANWVEEFDERHDPYGRPYYWLTGKFVNFEPQSNDTDEWALANGYISVVPTQCDLTAHKSIAQLEKILE